MPKVLDASDPAPLMYALCTDNRNTRRRPSCTDREVVRLASCCGGDGGIIDGVAAPEHEWNRNTKKRPAVA